MTVTQEQRPLSGAELLEQYLTWREGIVALVEDGAE